MLRECHKVRIHDSDRARGQNQLFPNHGLLNMTLYCQRWNGERGAEISKYNHDNYFLVKDQCFWNFSSCQWPYTTHCESKDLSPSSGSSSSRKSSGISAILTLGDSFPATEASGDLCWSQVLMFSSWGFRLFNSWGSQPWLHNRIIWGTFTKYLGWASPQKFWINWSRRGLWHWFLKRLLQGPQTGKPRRG